MKDLLSGIQSVFDLVILMEELSKNKILPLMTIPIRITWRNLPSCHYKEGKVHNLLHNIIRQAFNLLVQLRTTSHAGHSTYLTR